MNSTKLRSRLAGKITVLLESGRIITTSTFLVVPLVRYHDTCLAKLMLRSYYGAFVISPTGHNVEAVIHGPDA